MAEQVEDLEKVRYPKGIKNTNFAKGVVDLGDTIGHAARAGLSVIPDLGGSLLNTASAVGTGVINFGNDVLGSTTGLKFPQQEFTPYYSTAYAGDALTDAARSGSRLLRRMGASPVPSSAPQTIASAVPRPRAAAKITNQPLDPAGGTFSFNGKTRVVPKSTMTDAEQKAQIAENRKTAGDWIWDYESGRAINTKTGAKYRPSVGSGDLADLASAVPITSKILRSKGKTELPKNTWYGPDGKRLFAQEGTADEMDAAFRRGSAVPQLDSSSPTALLASAVPMAMNVGHSKHDLTMQRLSNEDFYRRWGVNLEALRLNLQQQLNPFEQAHIQAQTDREKALTEAAMQKPENKMQEQLTRALFPSEGTINEELLRHVYGINPVTGEAKTPERAADQQRYNSEIQKAVRKHFGMDSDAEAATGQPAMNQMPKEGETKVLSDGRTKAVFRNGQWQKA